MVKESLEYDYYEIYHKDTGAFGGVFKLPPYANLGEVCCDFNDETTRVRPISKEEYLKLKNKKPEFDPTDMSEIQAREEEKHKKELNKIHDNINEFIKLLKERGHLVSLQPDDWLGLDIIELRGSIDNINTIFGFGDVYSGEDLFYLSRFNDHNIPIKPFNNINEFLDYVESKLSSVKGTNESKRFSSNLIRSKTNKILEGANIRSTLFEDAKDDMRAEKLKTQDLKFAGRMSKSITDRAKWNRRLEAIKRICGEDSPQAKAFIDANPSMMDVSNQAPAATEPVEPIVQEPEVQAPESVSKEELIRSIKIIRYKVSEENGEIIATNNDNGYKIIEKSSDRYTLQHLYSDYEEEDISSEDVLAALRKQVGHFEYQANFGVLGFIYPKHHDEAEEYLSEEDMIKYYDDAQYKDISSITWNLGYENKGYILVKANARLGRDAIRDLKAFIDGQNSDGLGEGFEQQDFIKMGEPGRTIVAGNLFKTYGFESTSH